MSTDAQPPSPQLPIDSPPSTHKLSLFQKLRQKQPPPAALVTRDKSRRDHQRSSSFGGFVRRILPSHHEERGHTIRHSLRQKYEDNGSHAAVDLVFGLSDLPGAEVSETLSFHTEGIRSKSQSQIHRRLSLGDTSPSGGNSRCALAGESQSRKLARGTGWFRPRDVEFGPVNITRLDKADNEDEVHVHQQFENESDNIVRLPNMEVVKIENSESTKTQQMYEDKKVRRQQRRSLRESGDFLGVQGANPRTGYWDISSGTSSSEPSEMSEEMKRKLDQEAKGLEETKRKYEEAQAKYQAELSRVQSLRDNQKQDKEKRKMELKVRQRRHGKWKLSEQGWSSVAEPDLSPIVQSVVGSPTRETAPADRLFPMPCAADPTPYVNPHDIGPQDYFGHRHVSSPLARDRSSAHSASGHEFLSRKPVGSPVRQRAHHQSSNTIIRKGSPSKTAQEGSPIAETAKLQLGEQCAKVEIGHGTQNLGESILNTSPSHKFDSFLDDGLFLTDSDDPQESLATAISYQSISMSPAEILRQSGQSLPGTSLEKRYRSLRELPPVNLKDPFRARLPLNSQLIPPSVWAPPTIIVSPKRQVSYTSTPITTTTGHGHLQRLHNHFDGQSDETSTMSDALAKAPSLSRKTGRIPLRTSSSQRSEQHVPQKSRLQIDVADIATSSEHLLAQTKQRSLKLCHTRSPGSVSPVMKNTSISMSTFPRIPQQVGKVSPAAQTAAFTAFQRLKHQVAMKKAASRDREDSLTPPKRRTPKRETKDVSPRAKEVPGGRGVIGNPLRRSGKGASPDLFERRLVAAVKSDQRHDDSLVIWHPAPSAENRRSKVVANTGEVMDLVCVPRKGATSPARTPMIEDRSEILTLLATHHSMGIAPVRGESPQRAVQRVSGTAVLKPKPDGSTLVRLKDNKRGPAKTPSPLDNKREISPKSATQRGEVLHSMSGIAFKIAQTSWSIVEPVFDPESGPRRRWDRGTLTWSDMGLFVAAAVFMAVVLVTMVLSVRVLLVLFQVIRAIWSVLKILSGF